MILAVVLCVALATQVAQANVANIVIAPGPTAGSWLVTINGAATPTTCNSVTEIMSAVNTQASSATSYQVSFNDAAGSTITSSTATTSTELQSAVSSQTSGGSGGSDGSGSDGSSSDGSSSDGSKEGKKKKGSKEGSGEGKGKAWGKNKGDINVKVKCFAADSQVETRQGKMSMEQLFLNPTDVLTVDGQFTPVTMFFHANQDRMTEFNEIRTTESVLKATDGHLIYKEGGEVVSAAKIKTGDFLLNAQMEPVQVLSVQKVTQPGFYAPLTQTGHLMVDGHFVSSYSESETPMIQSLMFNYIQTITNLLPTRITQAIAGVSNPEAAVGFLELSQKFLA